MFEIIAVVAIVLAIAIAVVLALAAIKPNTLTIQRAITVRAPPDRIFPLITKSGCIRLPIKLQLFSLILKRNR